MAAAAEGRTRSGARRAAAELSRQLVDAVLAHPDLRHRAREVEQSAEDATPPGLTAM